MSESDLTEADVVVPIPGTNSAADTLANLNDGDCSETIVQTNRDCAIILYNVDPDNKYTTVAGRLTSFTHWPQQLRPTPLQLAEAGFTYTGKKLPHSLFFYSSQLLLALLGLGDRVTCFYCKGTEHHHFLSYPFTLCAL